MAGDWIPIRKDLLRCREVLYIAKQTGLTRLAVVGHLVELWCWVDSETDNGTIEQCDESTVLTASELCPIFVQALRDVKWIEFTNGSLVIMNFERWLGESAKKRLKDCERKRAERSKIQRPAFVRKKSKKKRTTEEKRRDNKDTEETFAQRARDIFAYWQQVFNHPTAVLGDDRKRTIIARLKDGYTVEDLRAAIDGCRRTPYNMGSNKQSRVYDDLKLICRDSAHVDQFRFQTAPQAPLFSERRAVIPG